MLETPTGSWAVFSPCRKWRYALGRELNVSGEGDCVFIGLNPSTADETKDDPTVRRCKRIALDWGCRSLVMLNIFAWRSTDPKPLYQLDDPYGPENDATLLSWGRKARFVVAAWGTHGALRERGHEVTRNFYEAGIPLQCLGITKEGFPKHPLYIKASTVPKAYSLRSLSTCKA